MKKSIAFLMLLTFASSAFATHSYRSETCLSQSTTQPYQLIYKGNYPFGGPSGLSKLGDSEMNEVVVWDKLQSAGSEDSVADENSFEIVRGKVISMKKTKDRCSKGDRTYFRHETSKTQVVINVANLSAEAEQSLGLQSGTYIIFNCQKQMSFPELCKK